MTKLMVLLVVRRCVLILIIATFLGEIFTTVNEIKLKNANNSKFIFRIIIAIFVKCSTVLLVILIAIIACRNRNRSLNCLQFKGSYSGHPLVITSRDPETYTAVESSPMFPDKYNKKCLLTQTSLGARHCVRYVEKGVHKKRSKKWTTLAAQKSFNFLGGGCAVMDPVTKVETSLNTPLTLGPGPQGRFGFLRATFVSNCFHAALTRELIFIRDSLVLEEMNRLALEEQNRLALQERNRRARQAMNRFFREERNRLARIILDSEEMNRMESNRLALEERNRLALDETNRLALDDSNQLARQESDRLARIIRASEERYRMALEDSRMDLEER